MRPTHLLATALLLMAGTTAASAQKSHLYEQMLENTQRVMIIDSVVVNRDEALETIRLGAEAGRIAHFDQFFQVDEQPEGIVYVNERESHCYYSSANDNGTFRIYSCDKVGDMWGEPQQLKGLNDDSRFNDINYPFALGDGMTLYFAAQGEESLGGYDIFATRFDPETGQYYRAENIGMPFNSEANDYMYAIDEMNRIGWFISDRNQPEDMVCVYIFEPSERRETYSSDDFSEAQRRRLARIASIKETWTDGREAAMERLKNIGQQSGGSQTTFRLVISDTKTYRQPSDCRTHGGAELFKRWQKMKQQEADNEAKLEKSRNYYPKALGSEKRTLKPEILKKEKEQEQLIKDIKAIEKEIRQTEQ